MKRYDLVSFDMQGSLTESAFSDHFWRELLPREYARLKGLSLAKAKQELGAQFTAMDQYDPLYYDAEYWIRHCECDRTLREILDASEVRPTMMPGAMEALERIGAEYPMIILSATTHSFIDVELGALKNKFERVFSSFDDFGLAGKPPEVYEKVARLMGAEPGRCLHVGDDKLMDVVNAKEAGWAGIHYRGAFTVEEYLLG